MKARWHPISRAGSTALVCALSAMLAGCSTVRDLAGIPRPGYQKDGTYVLSEGEHGVLTCRDLQERSLGLRQQQQTLSELAVKQMQDLPETLVSAWGRLVGTPEAGVPAVAEYNEARAEQAAVNASMMTKGCNSIESASAKN